MVRSLEQKSDVSGDMTPIKAIFLDRDGVVTERLPKHSYLLREEDISITSDRIEALRSLASHAPLFFVSNQQCVGKRLLSLEDAHRLHASVVDRLSRHGVTIQDSRLCPHLASDACACRKPKPGMILDLCKTHNMSPETSILIGDSPSDIDAALAAGCYRAFYLQHPGVKELPVPSPRVVCVDNLLSVYHACLTF